jgi:hypothetical protein
VNNERVKEKLSAKNKEKERKEKKRKESDASLYV